MSPYQERELQALYRQAVLLQVNPAGGQAYCECGCGRLGTEAHHAVRRSQEPAIRIRFEPRFSVWTCHTCHMADHEGKGLIMAAMQAHNPARYRCLSRLDAVRDRVRPRDVSFTWMRGYLRSVVAHLSARWADAYCFDGE